MILEVKKLEGEPNTNFSTARIDKKQKFYES